MTPKISVIIPTYNSDMYLGEAIQSVLAQTYNLSRVEIIVIDDCSTDKTQELVKKFGNKIINLRLEKNSGVLLATLAGLQKAKADIIAFLDADDIWMPEKLEEIMRVFNDNPHAGLVSHDYVYIDENGISIRMKDCSQEPFKRLLAENSIDELDAFMRRAVFSSLGLWLGSAYCIRLRALEIEKFTNWVYAQNKPELIYQDRTIACFMALNRQYKFRYINKVLFKYRIHSNNYSGSGINEERTLQIAQKSLRMHQICQKLLLQYDTQSPDVRITALKLAHIEFIFALYQGDFIVASKKFLHCATENFWDTKTFFKELLRFIGVLVLGLKRFVKLRFLINKFFIKIKPRVSSFDYI